MIHRRFLVACAAASLLAACGVFSPRAHLTSAAVLHPHQRATLHARSGTGRVAVELRGQGPGVVTFAARTSGGEELARGALGDGDALARLTSEAGLVVELTCGDRPGTVAYEVTDLDGTAVDVRLELY